MREGMTEELNSGTLSQRGLKTFWKLPAMPEHRARAHESIPLAIRDVLRRPVVARLETQMRTPRTGSKGQSAAEPRGQDAGICVVDVDPRFPLLPTEVTNQVRAQSGFAGANAHRSSQFEYSAGQIGICDF